jgi:catechol 2,3-dioxygenase-like lactoylglutathione lyase family enzyme
VIDHVDIRVSDRDASQRFYDTVLTVLGKERTDDPEYIDWGDFSIVADGQPVAKHLHIAFYAPSHELVDAFHRAGVEAGYTDDGAPGPRPQYREGLLRRVPARPGRQQRRSGVHGPGAQDRRDRPPVAPHA